MCQNKAQVIMKYNHQEPKGNCQEEEIVTSSKRTRSSNKFNQSGGGRKRQICAGLLLTAVLASAGRVMIGRRQ